MSPLAASLGTRDDVLTAFVDGKIDKDEASQRLEQLERKNGNGNGGGKVSFKVSVKGAVSVYGLQRMPVTLYAEQWERFAEQSWGMTVEEFRKNTPLGQFIVKHEKFKFGGQSNYDEDGNKLSSPKAYSRTIHRK